MQCCRIPNLAAPLKRYSISLKSDEMREQTVSDQMSLLLLVSKYGNENRAGQSEIGLCEKQISNRVK